MKRSRSGRAASRRRRGRVSASAVARKEQFFPALVYRTGPYAPNGVALRPTASSTTCKLVNERDGGINGVKITFEECETGYATDRGVECYERLKSKRRPARRSSSRCPPASPTR